MLAAFICSPQLFLTTINQLEPHRDQNLAWLFDRIFKSYKHFNGIHDCAMTLHASFLAIRFPIADRPPNFNNPRDAVTLFMELFENIKRCRAAIAENNKSESDSDIEDLSEGEEEGSKNKRKIELDLNDSDDDLNEGKLDFYLTYNVYF